MGTDTIVAVVAILHIVPNVRNTVSGEVIVIALGGAVNSLVIAAGCHEHQVRLLAAVPLECACCAGSCTDSSDVAEKIRSLHTDEERLSSAH